MHTTRSARASAWSYRRDVRAFPAVYPYTHYTMLPMVTLVFSPYSLHMSRVSSLVLCSWHSTRYCLRDRHVAVDWWSKYSHRCRPDTRTSTTSILKTRVAIASCAEHFIFAAYCKKRRFPPTTASVSACLAHNIEFDDSLIRARPTVTPCSHGQIIPVFTAGRVPICFRSSPPARFRFGCKYTNVVTCFLGGGGVVVAKKAGLMNMLEAQNTLVSIINPLVLTWGSSARADEVCRRAREFQ